MKRQDIENGVVVDKKEYGKKLLAQEKEFFIDKLNDLEQERADLESTLQIKLDSSEINQEQFDKEMKNFEIRKNFFEQKVKTVEHDLYIAEKTKYDIPRYTTYT